MSGTVLKFDATSRRWLVVNGQVQGRFLNGRAGYRAAQLALLRIERPELYKVTLDFILQRRAKPDDAIKAALALLEGRAGGEVQQAVIAAAKLPAQPPLFDLVIVTKRWGYGSKTSGREPILWIKLAGKPEDHETYKGLNMYSPQVRKMLEPYEWVENETRPNQLIRKFRRINSMKGVQT